MASDAQAAGHAGPDEDRRDFLYIATGAFATLGSALAMWPLIDSMNRRPTCSRFRPSRSTSRPSRWAQSITVTWRGQPVFIRRRTPAEIEEAAGSRWMGCAIPRAMPNGSGSRNG